jgi:hypothetical protein
MAHKNDTVMELRLAEFLAVDHAKLQAYLGSSAFAAISRRYAMSDALSDGNTRWFSRNLSKFLGETSPYSKNPELAEIARLEAALNCAFEAAEAPILSLTDFGRAEINGLENCRIEIHPSAHRLSFTTNATSIWSALKCDEAPPRPERLDQPSELLIWRQGVHPRFRILGKEEATAFDMARQGISVFKIATSFAKLDRAETPMQGAANYLRGWVEAELVSALPNITSKT